MNVTPARLRRHWREGETRLGPYELNTIVTGDARELAKAIPDESVDLVFTDPIYDRIDDYRWLAETAARVLKPDGAALVWCSIEKLPLVITSMSHALIYRWILTDVRIGFGAGRFVNGYSCRQSKCIVFNGQPKKNGMWDVSFNARTHLVRQTERMGIFKWAKHIDTTLRWIDGMTKKNAIVCDFFCGSGTVPYSCRMLDRNYIAFEIDPERAELAREHVAIAQPPLPMPTAKQKVLL